MLRVAEFERELIRERVLSVLANTKAKGKQLSRPRVVAQQVDEALSLLKKGHTCQEAAEMSGIIFSTLARA